MSGQVGNNNNNNNKLVDLDMDGHGTYKKNYGRLVWQLVVEYVESRRGECHDDGHFFAPETSIRARNT